MEERKYGENDEEVCGILFDGAWLWEEYVNTILQECGFKHPRNKEKEDPIYLFEDNKGKRYPDSIRTTWYSTLNTNIWAAIREYQR